MSNFCGSCGTQRSTPEQRFCSGCGATLAAPPPAATPPAHAAPPAYAAPAPYAAPPAAPPAGPVDYAVPQQLPPLEGGRRAPVGKILGIGALVLALTGGAIVAWAVLRPQGGADTPEAAVERFLQAVVEQDPVGALEVVNPGEVDGVDELYDTAYARLEDEGLVDGDSLSDAVQVEVENLSFEVQELGDSAARVVLTGGDYTVSFDPDKLPERLAFLAEASPDGESRSGDLVEDLAYELPDLNWENDVPEPFLTTVKVDDGWYVSAFGTVVDSILAEEINLDFGEYDVREPDYAEIGEVPDPIVGEDPEEVLDNLADAINSGDVSELLANLPADQVAALRPYARTLQDALDQEFIEFEVGVSDLDLETEELDDDRLGVTVERALLSGTTYEDGDVDSGTLEIDGRCFVASTEYDSDEECIGGEAATLGTLGVDSVYLVLQEVDGGYQLDPLATAIAYAQKAVDSVSGSMVDDILLEVQTDVTDECDYVEDGELVSCE